VTVISSTRLPSWAGAAGLAGAGTGTATVAGRLAAVSTGWPAHRLRMVDSLVAGVGGGGAAALVAAQQLAQRVARGQQHIHHLHGGRQLVAAQLVQQRLHLVGEGGHVLKAEGGRAALDRVGAAEDRVQLLVVGGRHVQLQQHLLHRLQVLAGLLEEDGVELREVDAGGAAGAIVAHLGHGNHSPDRWWRPAGRHGCVRGGGAAVSGSPCRSPRSAWPGRRA